MKTKIVSIAAVIFAMTVVSGMLAPSVAAKQSTAQQSEMQIAPGTRLASTVGIEKVNIQEKISSLAFQNQINNADANRSKANITKEEIEEIRKEIQELREEKQKLQTEYKNGEISKSKYRSEMAELAAEITALENRTKIVEEVARGLPQQTLEENGINVSAIQELKQNASSLSGLEVAKIARSISGEQSQNMSENARQGPPEKIGPPEQAQNETKQENNKQERDRDEEERRDNTPEKTEETEEGQTPTDNKQTPEESEEDKEEQKDKNEERENSDSGNGNGRPSDSGR